MSGLQRLVIMGVDLNVSPRSFRLIMQAIRCERGQRYASHGRGSERTRLIASQGVKCVQDRAHQNVTIYADRQEQIGWHSSL